MVGATGDRAIVKLILENAYPTDEEQVRGCRLTEKAGAHYVKTSTGFAPGGATLEDPASAHNRDAVFILAGRYAPSDIAAHANVQAL